MSEDEIPIQRRLIWILASGIPGAVYYVIIYVYLLPQALSQLSSSMGGGGIPQITGSQLSVIALFFLGLSGAAAGLKKTIYNPILRAVSNLFGFFILLYYMNGGKLEGSAETGTGTLHVFIDISPIIYIVFAFITLPGIIIPFYDYFKNDAVGD